MTHDAFVCYKSEDRAWAERLVQELAPFNLDIFWDRDSLVPGQPWKPQIDRALSASRALIVLWSEKSSQVGTWTDLEQYLFGLPDIRTPLYSGRRPVISVCLDSYPAALGDTHMIKDLYDLRVYPALNEVDAATWRRVARKIRTGMLGDREIEVQTLVLAARSNELTRDRIGAEQWNALEELKGLVRLEDSFESRYGESRWDWRPYGRETIRELLKEVEHVALRRNEHEIHFEEADEALWGPNPDAKRQAALRLSREPALILIDPFSLYDLAIRLRLSDLWPHCFKSRTNAFAVLAPHGIDDEALNQHLQVQLPLLMDPYFVLPIPLPENAASVGFHVRNHNELLRTLIFALSAREAPRQSKIRDVVLNSRIDPA